MSMHLLWKVLPYLAECTIMYGMHATSYLWHYDGWIDYIGNARIARRCLATQQTVLIA